MLTIKMLRIDPVVSFAAEELKKYLRMMMPRCGEIDITYDPAATDGFRLGLLEDFGLPNEAEDTVLDDVVHIDTTEDGGILAGSNPRSVLYAVYRFFKLNGCRWLYPGIDGEHIPMQDIKPQKYHHMADHRFRGHCNEGAESQTCMIETIDFYAKQELNVYMIEFDNPYYYYDSYYSHKFNTAHRNPEPITKDQALQWKRQCEVEIAKRGLQFHDMGHGWTTDSIGIESMGWSNEAVELTDEQRSYIAELKGVRDLYKGIALNTNLCMSNPSARKAVVDYVVKYAETNRNVTYLHVWLADSSRNQCECEECRKLRPSDYYLMIMNELDAALTAKNMDTRIMFICYFDTLWAPLQTTVRNSKRFSMLYAPIHRSYCSSIVEGKELPPAQEYNRNAWTAPPDADAHLALLRKWQKTWTGPTVGYEYHFWYHQCNDPSLLTFARRVYEDIYALKYMGISGYIEDGSQRSFFPNGLHMHIYAETLLNRNIDFEETVNDYLRHCYGADWEDAKAYFTAVSKAFNHPYLCGENSTDGIKGTVFRPAPGSFYNPEVAAGFAQAKALAQQAEALGKAHTVNPTRPQTVSWRLLYLHGEFIEKLGTALAEKCIGNDAHASELFEDFKNSFGRHEFEIERYYDHFQFVATYSKKFNALPRPTAE